MKKIFSFRGLALSGLLTASTLLNVCAQTAPAKQWDKTLGGSSNEGIYSIQQTTDGGYILGGFSQSGISGDKTQASQGSTDYWVVKLDGAGNKQWDKTFGGNSIDDLLSLQQTADGGYILGGYSLSGTSGDKTQASRGFRDYWVIKLDANGIKLWDKTIGGNNNDILSSVKQTSDGGYILGGYSTSGISGEKTQDAIQNSEDYWVVKLDASGNKLWDKTYGGDLSDLFPSVQQTADGGYILGGSSVSGISGDKTQASKGMDDYWVVKLDANGMKLWDKTFGALGIDQLSSLQQTTDGGYMLGGTSASGMNGDKSQASQGNEDFWMIKLNSAGNKVWDRSFGGSDGDYLNYFRQTSDGGYILGGESYSGISGDKTQVSQGNDDIWVVKINATGNKLWDKTLGGSNDDYLSSLQQTSDGSYILGGGSDSGISGDKSQASKGSRDFWVVKLGPDILGTDEATSTSVIHLSQNQPNPFSENTTINFNLTQPEEIKLTIYNCLGQTVAKQRKKYTAGLQQIEWKELVQNKQLKAGTYFYHLSAGSFQDTKRMILLNE